MNSKGRTAPSTEYVIVGGGVYGVATAMHLARAGAEVVLLESREIASGASGGLGKRGVRANGRDLRELPLMKSAYELWPSLESELGAHTGWERIGHLRLYERHHDEDAERTRALVQSAAGIHTVHLTRSQVLELEPGSSAVIRGALHCPSDGVADHTATTAAYAERAREHGAVLREHAEVEGVEVGPTGSTSVRLSGGELIGVGRRLLLANNGGVAPLVEGACGRRLPVWSVWPQVARTGPCSAPALHTVIGHAHRPLAVKGLSDGSVMLSGGWRGRWNPEEGRGETVPDSVDGNWQEALRVFPALNALQVVEAWADRAESCCVDGIPIIDQVPEAPRALVACGWTGHGWAMAPAVAPLIASWMLDGQVPKLLKPFSLARFPTAGRP